MDYFKELEEYIIKHRRHLHEHPELGFHCIKTHDCIRDRLKELGINYFPHIGKNSIVGVIENGKGPVIGIRADFDALPLQEETDLEFKSKEAGKMHACGHDSHTGMLLGTAKYLVDHLDEWKGTDKWQRTRQWQRAGERVVLRALQPGRFPACRVLDGGSDRLL